jgi:hypothetical protein
VLTNISRYSNTFDGNIEHDRKLVLCINECIARCRKHTVGKLRILALIQDLNHIFWLDIRYRHKLFMYILFLWIKIDIAHERMHRSLSQKYR